MKIPKGQSEFVYIEEEQTTQWPKEKVQKDKQRSTKHTYKTKDRVTRTPLEPGSEFRCSGRVGSSCSTSDTRRVNLVTNPVLKYIVIILYVHVICYWWTTSDVMVSVLDSCAVDRGLYPRSGQTKDYQTCICCFTTKHAAQLRKQH